MKPWTVPIVLAVGMCFVVFNTAGFVHCYHNSAPSPEVIFGWPNIYLITELTQSQWNQMRVDGKCAHGKPISARELPANGEVWAQVDRPALLSNSIVGLVLLGYTALVCDLWQRAFKTGAFTIRGGLLLTALTAIFIPFSRSGFVFLHFTQHVVFWYWWSKAYLTMGLIMILFPTFLLVKVKLPPAKTSSKFVIRGRHNG